MNSDLLVDVFVLFGGLIALMLALGQLLLKKKDAKNYLFAAGIFLNGTYQLTVSSYFFLEPETWLTLYPFLYAYGRFAVYGLVPLFYFYFKHLPDKTFTFKWSILLHLIPAISVVFMLLLGGTYPVDDAIIPGDYENYIYEHVAVGRYVSIGSMAVVIIYCLLLLKHYNVLYKITKPNNRNNLLAVVVIPAFSVFIVLWYFSYRSFEEFGYNFFKLRFAILNIFIMVISYRYPFILNIIKLEAYRGYYLKSHIENIHVDSVLEKLELLMNRDNIFSDHSLTVKKTACMLELSVHQLSEILNTKLGKTFNTYIQEKRINEAKKLLTTRPDMKVLEISLECGFNSLSNFNTTFKKIVGSSPTHYRKQGSACS
jgi:AraC-like DNA-binding protein